MIFFTFHTQVEIDVEKDKCVSPEGRLNRGSEEKVFIRIVYLRRA